MRPFKGNLIWFSCFFPLYSYLKETGTTMQSETPDAHLLGTLED